MSVLAVAAGALLAAGSGSFRSDGNTFTAATVQLTDGAGGAALFDPRGRATHLVPGDRASACVQVVYTTDATAGAPAVLMSGSLGAPDDADLATHLALTVQRGQLVGEPPTEGSCGSGFTPDTLVHSGTLATFLTAHPTPDRGAPTGDWRRDPAGDRHTFEITVELLDGAPSGAALSPVMLTWQSSTG